MLVIIVFFYSLVVGMFFNNVKYKTYEIEKAKYVRQLW